MVGGNVICSKDSQDLIFLLLKGKGSKERFMSVFKGVGYNESTTEKKFCFMGRGWEGLGSSEKAGCEIFWTNGH